MDEVVRLQPMEEVKLNNLKSSKQMKKKELFIKDVDDENQESDEPKFLIDKSL